MLKENLYSTQNEVRGPFVAPKSTVLINNFKGFLIFSLDFSDIVEIVLSYMHQKVG